MEVTPSEDFKSRICSSSVQIAIETTLRRYEGKAKLLPTRFDMTLLNSTNFIQFFATM